MGYEGHVVGLDRPRRARPPDRRVRWSCSSSAHGAVGGDIVSAGGTGTYDINTWATEIQAGSYALMDTAYGELDLPFRRALSVVATVISVNPGDGCAVADCGLKALGHGPRQPDRRRRRRCWFCSDEHVTFSPDTPDSPVPAVGDRVRVWPAHVDPTIAYHERMHVADGDAVVDADRDRAVAASTSAGWGEPERRRRAASGGSKAVRATVPDR